MALSAVNFSNNSNTTLLNCSEATSLLEDNNDNAALTWLRVSAYSITCFCGISGNLITILAVCNPDMRTISNVLIANLAVADLTVSLINIPTVLVYSHLGIWPFGAFLCKIIPFIQGMTLSASIATLIAIAGERYRHIVLYRRRRLTVRDIYKLIPFIWASSILIPLPMAIFSKTVTLENEGDTLTHCIEVWPSTASRKAYTALVFLLMYLIPLVLVSCLYVMIGLFLKRMPRLTRQASRRTPRKAIRMLVTVVILFALCWLPYHAAYIYIDFFEPEMTSAFVSFVLFAQWLIFANSICNPVVYAILNDNFKGEFIRMLCRRQPRTRRPRNAASTRIHAIESIV